MTVINGLDIEELESFKQLVATDRPRTRRGRTRG
jgi:hypothetical protein